MESAPLHLPVLHELVWNFLQKPRGPLENVAVAAAQTHMRVGQIKIVASASDGYVKQAPFFLQRIARIERAAARKHSLGQPDYEHGMELETFRLMHSGQIDRLLVACLTWRGLRVDVADQRQLRKKFMDIFELAGKHCELIEVFAAQFVVCEVHFGVVV